MKSLKKSKNKMISKHQQFKLPESWHYSPIKDIAMKLNSGYSLTNKKNTHREIFQIRPYNITTDGKLDRTRTKYVKIDNDDYLKKGDIVFNNTNSAKLVGKTSFIPMDTDWTYSSLITRIRTINSLVNYQWVAVCLQYLFHKGFYKINSTRSENRARISNTYLTKIKIPIPPLNEQHRITSKVTELFSKIDACEKIIENLKVNLKNYHQLISDLPITEVSKTKGLNQFLLKDIAEIRSGVTVGRKLKGNKVRLPYLRVANVQDGFFNLDVVKEIEILESEFDKWKLLTGDILLTEGGDWDKLGRGAVWKEQIKNCIHQNHIFRLRLNQKKFDPDFIHAVLSSSIGKEYFKNASKQTTNLASINSTQLKAFKISCPSINIQKKIMSKTRKMQELESVLRTKLEFTSKLVDQMKKSIIKNAFEGKLVN